MPEQQARGSTASTVVFQTRLLAEREFMKAILEGKTMGQAFQASRAIYDKVISKLEDEKP